MLYEFESIRSVWGNWRSRRLHESPTSWALLLLVVFFHGLAPVANMNTALYWGPIPVPWVTNVFGTRAEKLATHAGNGDIICPVIPVLSRIQER